jgi:TetR/AcrR family transcriptional regulator
MAILEAALRRFQLTGYRRTSMLDVAEEAQLSRAAVYVHFSTKEALFRASSEMLYEEHLASARRHLAIADPRDRLVGVLRDKLDLALLATTSPHGVELLDTTSQLCGDLTEAATIAFASVVKKALKGFDTQAAGMSVPVTADLLVALTHGLAGGAGDAAPDPAEAHRRLQRLVNLFAATSLP